MVCNILSKYKNIKKLKHERKKKKEHQRHKKINRSRQTPDNQRLLNFSKNEAN